MTMPAGGEVDDAEARRRRLEALLRQRAAVRQDPPLSIGQERLYRLTRMNPDAPLYNVAVAYRLRGPLDAQALDRAVRRIAERHDILRTHFPTVDGRPVQRIAAQPPEGLVLRRDLGADEIASAVAAEAAQRFDLATGPLWRVGLFRIGPEDHVLTLVMHHIITDGWSFVLILNELGALAAAHAGGDDDPLAPPAVQYAAYAERQRAGLSGPDIAAQRAYWQEHLAGSIPALALPTDRTGGGADDRSAASLPLVLPEGLGEALTAMARREGVSTFMLALTAFAAVLHRCSGQTDLLLCTPVTGRHRAQTREVVGYCNNILPIRLDLSGTPTLRDLLVQVRQVALAAHRNQDVPFETIAEAPALRRIPLSRCLFSMDMPWPPALAIDGVDCTPLAVETGSADFDLSVSLWPVGEGLDGTLRYKTALFSRGRIDEIAAACRTALATLAEAPDTPVTGLPAGPAAGDGATASADEGLDAPRFPLEEKLAQVWREVFDRRDIGTQDDFRAIGASSLAVATLAERLHSRLGIEIGPAELFRTGSIARLAAALEAQDDPLVRDPLAPIRPVGTKPPLFLFEGVGIYYPLTERLAADRPVYGLVPPTGAEFASVEEMASFYVEAILRLNPAGPCHLGGISFGGLVAFEAAQQLTARGIEVGLLALFDTPGPDAYTPYGGVRRLFGHARNLARLGMPYLIRKSERIRRRARGSGGDKGRKRRPQALDVKAQRRSFRRYARHYAYRPYAGPVVLFKLARRSALSDTLFDPELGRIDPELGWGKVAQGPLHCHAVPGNHISMLHEPNVAVVAVELDRLLD